MFKISKLLRALLWAGVFHMTEEDTSLGGGGGGGGLLPANGGGDPSGGQGGGQGGLLPAASNPWDSVPKSWAQEHHSHWTTVPELVRKLWHEREGHYEKGIRTYSTGHQNWQRLQKVFEQEAQANPDHDWAGLYETLANNHRILSTAEPAERAQLFKQLAATYGVELGEVKAAAVAAGAGQGQPGAEDMRRAIQNEINKALSPFQQREQQRIEQEFRAQVDAFWSDPKNDLINEAWPGMVELMKSGQVRDLGTAYEMAILRSPELKAKYLANLAAGQGGQGGTEGAGGDRNLRSSGEGAPSGKAKSMDDEMADIVNKHYGAKTKS